MVEKRIYAFSGSGKDVIQLIENSVNYAVSIGDLPASNDQMVPISPILVNLQRTQDNIILMANAMVNDAVEQRVAELHEWSISSVRRKLCPLYPFFSEPCI